MHFAYELRTPLDMIDETIMGLNLEGMATAYVNPINIGQYDCKPLHGIICESPQDTINLAIKSIIKTINEYFEPMVGIRFTVCEESKSQFTEYMYGVFDTAKCELLPTLIIPIFISSSNDIRVVMLRNSSYPRTGVEILVYEIPAKEISTKDKFHEYVGNYPNIFGLMNVKTTNAIYNIMKTIGGVL